MVELANIIPGQKILDLACGTGLASYNASNATGPAGSVVGVDISSGMLAQAKAKLSSHQPQNVEFHMHSIADLDTLEALKGKTFDVILCVSALVLLDDPFSALKQWTTFLKPGGKLVVDSTHPRSQVRGMTFERVGKLLGLPMPYNRSWSISLASLTNAMEAAGLAIVHSSLMAQMDMDGKAEIESYMQYDPENLRVEHDYDVLDADGYFEGNVDYEYFSRLAGEGVRERAKVLFREEWERLADKNGKIHEVDCVFVGIGQKD